MPDRSSPSREVINPEGVFSAPAPDLVAGAGVLHPTNADITSRAIVALRERRDTYTRGQVAYLMALAFNSGAELGKVRAAEDFAEDAASWREFAQPWLTREQRVGQRLAEMEAAERARIRREHQRPATGGTLDAVDWPPVAVPGATGPKGPKSEWNCPCRRRSERHFFDGFHRTSQPFPASRRQSQYRAAA